MFCRDLVKNNFYGHSLPTADSSRAVVSGWQRCALLVLVNHFGSLPRNSVDWLTDGSLYVPQVPLPLNPYHHHHVETGRFEIVPVKRVLIENFSKGAYAVSD